MVAAFIKYLAPGGYRRGGVPEHVVQACHALQRVEQEEQYGQEEHDPPRELGGKPRNAAREEQHEEERGEVEHEHRAPRLHRFYRSAEKVRADMCQCGVFGIMAQQSCAGCALYAVADGGDEQCADEAKQSRERGQQEAGRAGRADFGVDVPRREALGEVGQDEECHGRHAEAHGEQALPAEGFEEVGGVERKEFPAFEHAAANAALGIERLIGCGFGFLGGGRYVLGHIYNIVWCVFSRRVYK